MKKDLQYFLNYTKQNGDCLEWTRCFNTDGYPRTVWNKYSNGKVHRIVYQLFTGNDPEGLVVRHTCDNPKCINPEHLILGTAADNMLDRDSRGRHGASKTTLKDVQMIRDLYSTGRYLQKEIADLFGINHRTVSSIVTFTHYKHVKNMQED